MRTAMTSSRGIPALHVYSQAMLQGMLWSPATTSPASACARLGTTGSADAEAHWGTLQQLAAEQAVQAVRGQRCPHLVAAFRRAARRNSVSAG